MLSDLSKERLLPVVGIRGFSKEVIFELDLKKWVGSQEAGMAGEDFWQNKDLEAVRHGENLEQQVSTESRGQRAG